MPACCFVHKARCYLQCFHSLLASSQSHSSQGHETHALQGDSRFILFATASGKSYLTIPAAGEVLKPLIDQAGDDFKLVDLKVRPLSDAARTCARTFQLPCCNQTATQLCGAEPQMKVRLKCV